ncbi:MAG: hypothetical protein MUF51_05695 [Vicinamibacteria bacterium]|jgi:hypothetical protein|nr:hypothetical protein [Vicinamibacteria bacterium]
MLPDLERLIDLQRIEARRRQVQTALDEIPRQKQESENRLAQERAQVETARAALTDSQKNRRQHEGSLQELETKRSKYKGQLMEVKTNKEYTAMLHEIEAVEREIRALEDRILEEMESTETGAVAIKQAEALFKQAEAHHRAECRALDEKAQSLAADSAKLQAERDQIAAALPTALVELFQRVARLRGTGVAEAREGRCQQCNVTLIPQLYVDLKKNDHIQQCPSCSRVLYYEPPAPVVDVEP